LLLCSGNAHYLADDYHEAMARYLTAFSVRADWVDAKKNLAMCYEKLGMLDRAIVLWEELASHERYLTEAGWRLRDLREAAELEGGPE
jgi:tetratricopeptide (TPR) repeat protein